MIVVDSSVWIDYFRAKETTATRFLRTSSIESHILIGDVILLEVLQGAENDRHAYRMESWLRSFRIQGMAGANLAVAASRNYRILRAKGITIRKTVDLIIGTFCIEHGHSLIHQDRDFNPMSEHLGLKIVET